MRGLLLRKVPVRLVNLSVSGFLLESDCAIATGTTGRLHLELGSASRRDYVHVTRSVERHGAAHRFLLGGEFSRGHGPETDSVRELVRAVEDRPPSR